MPYSLANRDIFLSRGEANICISGPEALLNSAAKRQEVRLFAFKQALRFAKTASLSQWGKDFFVCSYTARAQRENERGSRILVRNWREQRSVQSFALQRG